MVPLPNGGDTSGNGGVAGSGVASSGVGSVNQAGANTGGAASAGAGDNAASTSNNNTTANGSKGQDEDAPPPVTAIASCEKRNPMDGTREFETNNATEANQLLALKNRGGVQGINF